MYILIFRRLRTVILRTAVSIPSLSYTYPDTNRQGWYNSSDSVTLTLLICTNYEVQCFQRNQQIGCLTKVVGKKLLSCMYSHLLSIRKYSLVPRLFGAGEGKEEPGTHRSRMRLFTVTFHGFRILSAYSCIR